MKKALKSALLLSLSTLISCSASRPAQPSPEKLESRAVAQPAPPSSADSAPGPVESQDTDGGEPESIAGKPQKTLGKPATPAAKDGTCPTGMVLVEGEYCSDVDYVCKRSWYDKSNKKEVCEEFEAKSTCAGKKTKKRFCIDQYEWPNQAGARPEVMNRFHQAQVKCAAVGKRMCTESEWTLSCEGPRMLPFPYGYVRDTNKCHGDVMWDSPDMKKVAQRDPEELARLWKGVRSGSQKECVSEYGVYDLPGNADEVVASEHHDDPSFKGKYDSIHTGGPWYKGVRNQCRPKIYTHDEGFYYYFLSFRCCAEPEGKPTDPRTPKQVKENWKWSRVEKLAGFTLEQMKEKLSLKEKGQCTCSEKDILCKTMCGTLLGSKAKDYK